MKRIKIYMSHAIRGSKGPAATDADMQANNDAAMRVARVIRAWLYPLPVDVYCPADHDELVLIAYRRNYLKEGEILAVDCKIIEGCDGLIWYSGLGPSSGAEIEIKCAISNGIPVFTISCLEPARLTLLTEFVEGLCQKDTETN